jgi:hypothetical protein
MKLVVSKKGSQRASAPVRVEFVPNWAGQGGIATLTFEGDDGKYYTFSFANLEEVRELLSQSHIVWHNFRQEEELNDLKRLYGILPPKEANTTGGTNDAE